MEAALGPRMFPDASAIVITAGAPSVPNWIVDREDRNALLRIPDRHGAYAGRRARISLDHKVSLLLVLRETVGGASNTPAAFVLKASPRKRYG